MSDYSEAAVLKALATVSDPLTERDIVSAGRLADLTYTDRRLRIILAVPPETTQAQGLTLQQTTEAALQGLPGIDALAVMLTTHKAGPNLRSAKPARGANIKAGRNPHPNRRPDGYQGDAQVKRVIAIASAKGGVGKSTVTIGLARALAAKGLSVGVLDADVHGPSVPTLLGLSGQRGTRDVEGRRLIIPGEVDGVKALSIGLLTGNDDPIVWRGPMVQGAMSRMLWDTDWGALDVLLIDMPPGTGDPQLGLAQDIQPYGAVIVTTPQDLSLIDARKGVAMFEAVDIRVLGWVENMATFTCSDCGTVHHLFGEGELELAVPKLASLPLSLEMRDARGGYEGLADAFLGILGRE
jgi:ATP-binding protein involved in chromosome partitioning